MPKDNLNQRNPRTTEFPRESSAPTLACAAPHLVHLRDGEVVVYRRPESPLWQCRYKRQDGSWLRATTHQASVERAVAAACLLYDAARFRQKLGLAQKGCNFTELAPTTLVELRASMGTGEKRGKSGGAKQDALFAQTHRRDEGIDRGHGHSHAGAADGHFNIYVGAALRQAGADVEGCAVGLKCRFETTVRNQASSHGTVANATGKDPPIW